MADRSGDKQRITQLDGIRALAIAMVFLNHVFRAKLMWAGVDLFFILSGFLITGILIAAKHRPLGDYFAHFYGRRVRRILPPYLLLLAVTALFFGLWWLRYGYMYLFLMNAVYTLHMPQPGNLVILWSLAVEEQFYLFWPFVIFFLRERAIAAVAFALVLLAPILRYLCTPFFSGSDSIYMLTPFRMDLLAAGALLAILWRHRRHLIERWGVFGPLLTAAAVATMLLLSRRPGFSTTANTRFGNVWIYELTLLASAGIVLWALSGRYVAPLKWSWVRYLGRISYTFYLIHATALILLERYLTARYTPAHWQLALLTLAVSLAYSALSWRFFEQPILYARPGTRVCTEALTDEHAITNEPA